LSTSSFECCSLASEDVPFKLASRQTRQHYIDGKHVVDPGARLAVVSQAVVDLAAEWQIEFDATGTASTLLCSSSSQTSTGFTSMVST
jgi:hypothetical protein